jgi:ethanolamine ammonia-lyase small subunit
MGRSGSSYLTSSQLALRQAHAAAADAVQYEFDLRSTLGEDFCSRWNLFEVCTLAGSKAEYLLRPDRGRQLSSEGKQLVAERCVDGADIQIVIGDGLSVAAVAAQVPPLLPMFVEEAERRGLSIGQTFAIRYCRVGVLNEVGDLLKPRVAILLIGERPGLATVESLSAYMAYQPAAGHTDANRNLVSNIHTRGTPPAAAAKTILQMASAMASQKLSGTRLVAPDLRILP